MASFGLHTKFVARSGKRDLLVGKLLEVIDMQRSNAACELTLISESPDDRDIVYLTEVWTSEAAHTEATESDAARAWGKGMPELIDPERVDTDTLIPVGAKGLPIG